jgi:ATP-dependent protease ClpP protease subunit
MFQIWACEENYLLDYLQRVYCADNPIELDAALKKHLELSCECDVACEGSILSISGSEARIQIRGFLSEQGPPLIAKLFGIEGTSYNDINSALTEAQLNSDVKTIVLEMNTPGGEVSGTDGVWSKVKELAEEKTVIAENHGMIASAGYWIASAADKIVAKSPAVETGSIGVVATQINTDKAHEAAGVRVVTVVSQNAPNKWPDGTTDEGLAVLQSRVDAIERVFISRIAEGRGLPQEKIKKEFGRGALMIADDPDAEKKSALAVGMIDGVENGMDGVAIGPGIVSGYLETGLNDMRPSEIAWLDSQTIEAGATPSFQNLPIVDKPWDAGAAAKRVKQKTGSSEKPSASYKNAFFWYDSAEADKFGSYKLPFVDVVDGRLVAVRRGVFAANGAMKGARGGVQIPSADRSKVQSHIDKYIKKIEKEDAKKKPASAGEQGKVNKMDLKELMAQDHALAAEVKELIAAAEKRGATAVQEKVSKVIPKLESTEYPAPIRVLACKVLSGESEYASLEGAVTLYDSLEAEKKTAAAQADTEEAGETAAQTQQQGISVDGTINTEDEYQAEVAVQRKALGYN